MAASAARTPQLTFDEGSVIGFKDSQAGVEQATLGDDDDVESRRDLVATENLSNQTFSSIPLDRAPELPGGRDPQPAVGAIVGQEEERGVPP